LNLQPSLVLLVSTDCSLHSVQHAHIRCHPNLLTASRSLRVRITCTCQDTHTSRNNFPNPIATRVSTACQRRMHVHPVFALSTRACSYTPSSHPANAWRVVACSHFCTAELSICRRRSTSNVNSTHALMTARLDTRHDVTCMRVCNVCRARVSWASEAAAWRQLTSTLKGFQRQFARMCSKRVALCFECCRVDISVSFEKACLSTRTRSLYTYIVHALNYLDFIHQSFRMRHNR